jgi:tripartite-type tricarboxylate transporter receptor subunit TctC
MSATLVTAQLVPRDVVPADAVTRRHCAEGNVGRHVDARGSQAYRLPVLRQGGRLAGSMRKAVTLVLGSGVLVPRDSSAWRLRMPIKTYRLPRLSRSEPRNALKMLDTLAVALVAGAALGLAPLAAQAQQKYPNKPIRLVASTTAGSQPDTLARMIAQKMSENWGQPVVIDNRAGAGGTLAAGSVARAAPDGHTLLYVLPNFTISAVLQPSLPYDALKDFVAISQVGMSTNVLVVAPSLGARTVKDFIALAKAQPGKLIHASSAVGSASHLTGARFNLIAGIKTVTVAFKGGPDATIEILGGTRPLPRRNHGCVLPFVKDGKLVALGVTTLQRAPVLPDVPTLGEVMPEFKRPETSHGLVAPAGTPRSVVNQLNKEVARIFELPDVRERVQSISFVTVMSTPEEYAAILRNQLETLRKLVVDAGLKPNGDENVRLMVTRLVTYIRHSSPIT